MDEEKKAQLSLLKNELVKLGKVVYRMLEIYEGNAWLNDELDITEIIPGSLDEWHLGINGKIYEIENM